jgi:hypothetical protein
VSPIDVADAVMQEVEAGNDLPGTARLHKLLFEVEILSLDVDPPVYWTIRWWVGTRTVKLSTDRYGAWEVTMPSTFRSAERLGRDAHRALADSVGDAIAAAAQALLLAARFQ